MKPSNWYCRPPKRIKNENKKYIRHYNAFTKVSKVWTRKWSETFVSVCLWVCSQQNTVYQRERKVRRTLTSTRFQRHMPTVTTNTGLKCCFKLCVYLFYLLKKTLHTYTHYLDKYKAPNPCSCFWVQHTEEWGWVHSRAWCFYEGQDPSLQCPVRGQSQWNTAVPSSAALSVCSNHRNSSLTPQHHALTVLLVMWPCNSACRLIKIIHIRQS